jgi:hypothetical protein
VLSSQLVADAVATQGVGESCNDPGRTPVSVAENGAVVKFAVEIE